MNDTMKLPTLSFAQQIRVYRYFLDAGLTSSASFTPCFTIRMRIQLAAMNKTSVDAVVEEALLFSTITTPIVPAPVQLSTFQMVTTDNLIRMIQHALGKPKAGTSPSKNASGMSSSADSPRNKQTPVQFPSVDQE